MTAPSYSTDVNAAGVAPALTIGGSVDGDIETLRDTDSFTVTLRGGTTYYFALDGTGSNPLGDPYLLLLNPSGPNQVNGDAPGSKNAFLVFTAPYGADYVATYTLVVSGSHFTDGHYTLSSGVMPVDTIAGDTTTTASLALGQTTSDYISGGNDSDWYAVTLTAGTAYEFTLTNAAAGPIAGVNMALFGLANGAGQTVSFDILHAGDSTSQVYYTPATTGIYYVSVNDFTDQAQSYPYPATTGDAYSVSMVTAPTDIDAAGSHPLTIGQDVASLISSDSDTDTYSLVVPASETVCVYVTADGGQPMFSTTLGYSHGDLNSHTTAHVILPAGDYDLAVSGAIGTYTVHSEVLPADQAGDISTQASLTVGRAVDGDFSSPKDRDWYVVNLTAGQSYLLTTNSMFNAETQETLQLRDAKGHVLAGGTGAYGLDGTSFLYTATTTGNYYVSVGATSQSSNEYRVVVETSPDTAGDTTATAAALALNHVTPGAIDFLDDSDWYAISVVSGQTYLVEGQPTGVQNGESIGVELKSTTTRDTLYTDAANNAYDVQFTATETGTVYVRVFSRYAGLHNTSYTISASVIDDLSNGVDTSATLAIGGAATSAIDFIHDQDWFAVDLQAGHDYVFNINGDVTPQIGVRDPFGKVFYVAGDDSDTGTIHFHADTTATYFLAVGDYSGFGTGGYTVTAQETHDIFDQPNTATTLADGGVIHSSIDTATDQDWIRVELTAGQSYSFDLEPGATGGLNAGQVLLYDANGNILAGQATGPTGHDAILRYTATQDGTYFVAAAGLNGATGAYDLHEDKAPPQDPLNTIDRGTKLANGDVKIYFATSGQTFGDAMASRAWSADEITAFLAAAGKWSAVANIHITQVSDASAATLIVVVDSSHAGGAINATATSPEVGVFAGTWGGDLTAGSAAYVDFLRETGHALGLTNPQGWEGVSETMEGVYGLNNPGPAGLNQGAFTIMSDLAGWRQPFYFGSSNGTESGPMALDIAVAQSKYGAVAHNAGDDIYTVASGLSVYSAIWDTGGRDTVAAGTDVGSHIDLRAATLLGQSGGGGYVSYIQDQLGGLTIAHGVVIENATGGAGRDTLIGNAGDNILTGGGGDDDLYGGLGNDTLAGGDGMSDAANFSLATFGIAVDFNQTGAQDTHEGLDTFSGIEMFIGSAYDDVLTASATTSRASGGAGDDTLVLSGNFADYTYTAGYPYDQIGGNGINIQIDSFEHIRFADKTVDVSTYHDQAPYIIGDLSGVVLQGGVYTVTTDDLNVTDPDSTHVVFSIVSGNLGVVYVNGVAQPTFTVADLQAGLVQFHQIGDPSANNYYAGFSVEASDGILPERNGFAQSVGIRVQTGVLLTGDGGNNVLTGGDAGDIIYGGAGNDTIHGGAGQDYLFGGAGDDVIYVERDGAVVDGGDGFDTVSFAGASAELRIYLGDHAETGGDYGYTILRNVEKVIGSSWDDTLSGTNGDDVLDGGAGTDTMSGGDGNDTYYVDTVNDIVQEGLNSGQDTVVATTTGYTLALNVENLTLAGSGNIDGTGNNLRNTLVGNSGNNILDGGSAADIMIGGLGNDTYKVDHKGDVVTENAGGGTDTVVAMISYTLGDNVENLSLGGNSKINGAGNGLNNTLTGNSAANILTGLDGNDILDGGAGADKMYGGAGNDTYYVDNAGDAVIELAGGGIDTVVTARSYTLGADVEKLTLTGSNAIGGTGNSLANVILGNDGNNKLSGLVGNDTLSGGLGNDVLDGGKGADVMKGGAGDDRYYVENTGDVVSEYSNSGHDTVVTTLNYALGANVEDLIQVGTHDYYASGNAQDNHLTGNIGNNLFHGGDGNDVIDGGKGADKMYGGLGNDTFYVDNIGDVIVEYTGQGNDTVISTITYTLGGAVENLTLGGTANINGTGTSGDNMLMGNAGNNSLTGGKGHDTLTGGAGADTFVFGLASGADTVTDFSASQGDKIDLSAYTHGTVHSAYIQQVGSDTRIDLGGGNVLILTGVIATDNAFLNHILW